MKKLEKEILCSACIENKLCFQKQDQDAARNYCIAIHAAKYKGRRFYGVEIEKMQYVLNECIFSK